MTSRLQRGGLTYAQHPHVIGEHATCCGIELLLGHHDVGPLKRLKATVGLPRAAFLYGDGLGRLGTHLQLDSVRAGGGEKSRVIAANLGFLPQNAPQRRGRMAFDA